MEDILARANPLNSSKVYEKRWKDYLDRTCGKMEEADFGKYFEHVSEMIRKWLAVVSGVFIQC